MLHIEAYAIVGDVIGHDRPSVVLPTICAGLVKIIHECHREAAGTEAACGEISL